MTPGTGTPSPTADWPCWWLLKLPYPMALPADLAAEWSAKGRPNVFYGTWEQAVQAGKEPGAAQPAAGGEGQMPLFGTEAA